jgi:hypothetical protein
MDVSDASYYIIIHENNENKGSQMGHTKKIFKKKTKKKNIKIKDYCIIFKIFQTVLIGAHLRRFLLHLSHPYSPLSLYNCTYENFLKTFKKLRNL